MKTSSRFLPILAALAVLLSIAAPLSAADWMINEDYKQTDPRGATDFDILLRLKNGSQITGGGRSSVTNPFNNPSVQVSTNNLGVTTVRFVGDNAIPGDPNAIHHVGVYGNGPKPTVLTKAWSFPTHPKRVPVPKSNFDFVYDPATGDLTITVENTSNFTVTFSEVGYLISDFEYPIEELARPYLPPDAFIPAEDLSGELAPGDSLSMTLSGVPEDAYALTYGSVQFTGDAADNAYTDFGGEWSQVRVGSQTENDGDVVAVPTDPKGTVDGQ